MPNDDIRTESESAIETDDECNEGDVEGKRPLTEERPEGVKRQKGMSETFAKPKENLRKVNRQLIGKARVYFTAGNFETCLETLHAAIRARPQNPDAYQLMGQIAEEKGDHGTALELWLLQAHFEKTKASLWCDLYHYANKLGRKAESVYCFTKYQRLVKTHSKKTQKKAIDPALKKKISAKAEKVERHRLQLLEEVGEWGQAEAGYRRLLEDNPLDTEIVSTLCRLNIEAMLPHRALIVAERFIERSIENQSETNIYTESYLCICNILVELHLDNRSFSKAKSLTVEIMKLFKVENIYDLHPDLSIKYCIADIYLGNINESLTTFDAIRREGVSTTEFGDLFFDMSQALLNCGAPTEALAMLEEVARTEGCFQPIVQYAMAKCNSDLAAAADDAVALRRRRIAEKLLTEVHRRCPEHIETRKDLATIKAELGCPSEEVITLLDYNSYPKWSTGETLQIAYHKYNLCKTLRLSEEQDKIGLSIVTALSTEPLKEDRRTAAQGGRLKQMLHKADFQATQIVTASSVVHRQGDSSVRDSAASAIANVPISRNYTEIEVNRALAKYGTLTKQKPSDKPAPDCGIIKDSFAKGYNRLDATTKTPSTVINEEQARQREAMEVARFLEGSTILQMAYDLSIDETHESPNDERGDIAVDEEGEENENNIKSTLITDLIRIHGRVDIDEEAPVEPSFDPFTSADTPDAKFNNEITTQIDGLRQARLRNYRRPADAAAADRKWAWSYMTIRSVFFESRLGKSALWEVIKDLVPTSGDIAGRIHKSSLVMPLLYRGVIASSKLRLFTKDERLQVRQILIAMCLSLGDYRFAFAHIRTLLHKNKQRVHGPRFWNTINTILQNHFADLRGLLPSTDVCFEMCQVIGNVMNTRHGSTKLALGPLLRAHGHNHNDPISPLCAAICYLKLISPRDIPNRHYTFLHGLAFMDTYKRLRSADPRTASEIEFNIGRFYHQVGLRSTAIHHYKKVLELAKSREFPEDCSMHREAAFCLGLIYKETGNQRAAIDVLSEYIKV